MPKKNWTTLQKEELKKLPEKRVEYLCQQNNYNNEWMPSIISIDIYSQPKLDVCWNILRKSKKSNRHSVNTNKQYTLKYDDYDDDYEDEFSSNSSLDDKVVSNFIRQISSSSQKSWRTFDPNDSSNSDDDSLDHTLELSTLHDYEYSHTNKSIDLQNLPSLEMPCLEYTRSTLSQISWRTFDPDELDV